jgi:nucleoside-triphosphatase THEP1
MIGGFAINKESTFWKSLFFTKDRNQAYSQYLKCKGSFINMKETQNGTFYQVFNESISINIDTEKPIYNMIVQLEAIEVYKMKMMLEHKGAIILEYKTDAIRYYIEEFPFKLDGQNIKGYYFDKDKKVLKYKVEYKDSLKCEMKPKYIRYEKFKYVQKEFKIIPDVLDNDFSPLVEKILDLKGAFITGCAGSGKSFLINEIIKELKVRDTKNIVLATTNLAAVNIGNDAITIDMYCNKLKSKKQIENCTDYIIIDEVSMMKSQFYNMLNVIRRFKASVTFILCGHFLQYGPVCDIIGQKDDDFYMKSSIFHELTDSNIVELTTCRRSDNKHYKYCQDYLNVKLSDYGNSTDTNLHICYTNVKRIQLNEICMNKDRLRIEKKNEKHLKNGDSKSKYARFLELPMNKLSKISQDVYLCQYTPLISITNKKNFDIINSERFEVADFDDEFITITNPLKTKRIDVPIDKFQKFFHVAYCITSHKSQAATFTVPHTIHEWNSMTNKCKYVSLSRSSKWEYVNLV